MSGTIVQIFPSEFPIKVMGRPYKMSDDPPTVRLGPPALGEANSYVVHDLLGL